MRERRSYFDLDATQDLYAEERAEYARRLYGEGMAALRAMDLKIALSKLKVSARAFPSPIVLRQVGECLLRQGKPADAVLYLAAAVGMTPPGKHAHPLLLLVTALLRAREKAAALVRYQELAAMFPDMKEALAANPEDALEELLRRVERQTALSQKARFLLTRSGPHQKWPRKPGRSQHFLVSRVPVLARSRRSSHFWGKAEAVRALKSDNGTTKVSMARVQCREDEREEAFP